MKRKDLAEMAVGACFVMLGLAMFVYARWQYDLGELSEMGPGFFPSALGLIMAFLGALVSISGLGVSPQARDFSLKPAALITLAVIFFALFIETIGALFAIFALVFISSFAENKLSWAKKLILFGILFIVAYVIFRLALNMNFSIIQGVL